MSRIAIVKCSNNSMEQVDFWKNDKYESSQMQRIQLLVAIETTNNK